jgi:hypothetical protein
MRHLLFVVVIAACQREHDLTVLLGPNATTASQGFTCKQDADPTKYLLQDPATFDGTTVHFNVVVDIVSFGGRLPGCRGEEIIQSCRSSPCTLVASPGVTRYCQPVSFPVTLANDRAKLMATITQQLAARPIIENAPNEPVMLRAVATSQPCSAITTPTNNTYPALDGSAAVGCAYSCPAVLDDVSGPISLSIDALDDQCESIVRVCAGFSG